MNWVPPSVAQLSSRPTCRLEGDVIDDAPVLVVATTTLSRMTPWPKETLQLVTSTMLENVLCADNVIFWPPPLQVLVWMRPAVKSAGPTLLLVSVITLELVM